MQGGAVRAALIHKITDEPAITSPDTVLAPLLRIPFFVQGMRAGSLSIGQVKAVGISFHGIPEAGISFSAEPGGEEFSQRQILLLFFHPAHQLLPFLIPKSLPVPFPFINADHLASDAVEGDLRFLQ